MYAGLICMHVWNVCMVVRQLFVSFFLDCVYVGLLSLCLSVCVYVCLSVCMYVCVYGSTYVVVRDSGAAAAAAGVASGSGGGDGDDDANPVLLLTAERTKHT